MANRSFEAPPEHVPWPEALYPFCGTRKPHPDMVPNCSFFVYVVNLADFAEDIFLEEAFGLLGEQGYAPAQYRWP